MTLAANHCVVLIICVFLMKVMLQSSMVVAMSVYGIAALLAALACTLLPIETKGKELKETVVFNK